MAKKKHRKKKHNFQHKAVAPVRGSAEPVASVASEVAEPKVTAKPTGSAASGRVVAPEEAAAWQAVSADVRKVLWLGAGCIVVLTALWLLLDHTSVGAAVYRLLP